MIASSDKKMVESMMIREKNVPFKARILAAVPGKSLNNRIYTREVLQQSAPFYDGKPFILDHDIEHAERVVGVFSHPRYATERGIDDQPHEGLWLDAVGLMDEQLFEKVKGTGFVPPLVRGFSIGGGGDGELRDDGILIKKFMPAEGSITAFPGIPQAHIATINMIRESLLGQNQSHGVKKTEPEIVENATANAVPVQVPKKGVFLDLDEKTGKLVMNELKEGPIPDQDTGAGTRQQNDVRPGLPTPGRGKPVTHQQPQATTSADTSHPAGSSHPEKPVEAALEAEEEEAHIAISKTVGTWTDHLGLECAAAHPGMTHDEFVQQELNTLKQAMEQVKLAKQLTHVEAVIPLAQAKETDEPTGVSKTDQGIAHPEDVKKTENPVLKTAGVESTLGPPDIVPIQARAYSLPVDTNIYQMALRLDKIRNADRTQEAQEYIKAWNEAKKPVEQPLRTVRVKSNIKESAGSPVTQHTIIPTIRPTVAPRDETSVPTRSITNTAPAPIPKADAMMGPVSVSTLNSMAIAAVEQVRKEPMPNWNVAGRAWRKMLPQILQVD